MSGERCGQWEPGQAADRAQVRAQAPVRDPALPLPAHRGLVGELPWLAVAAESQQQERPATMATVETPEAPVVGPEQHLQPQTPTATPPHSTGQPTAARPLLDQPLPPQVRRTRQQEPRWLLTQQPQNETPPPVQQPEPLHRSTRRTAK